MRLVGDLSGKAVLDLACGEGFYSREFMRQGATRVVGVDSSPAMISLARTAERAEPLGIEYVLADVQKLDLGQQFDLVVAAFLLNYASSADELRDMCGAVARHLKPGCRFATVNSNPQIGAKRVDYRQYGFERLVPADLSNGCPYVFRNYQDDTSFDITVCHLDVATHEQAFAAAGLTERPLGAAGSFFSRKSELRLRILGDVPARSADHPDRVSRWGLSIERRALSQATALSRLRGQ